MLGFISINENKANLTTAQGRMRSFFRSERMRSMMTNIPSRNNIAFTLNKLTLKILNNPLTFSTLGISRECFFDFSGFK
jgi:hypothetical protein